MKPTFDMDTIRSGVTISETPPASARAVSPARRLWQARWMATSDDEQAVSIERLGPRRSRKYDRRLASTLCKVPVKVRASIEARSRYCKLA